MSPCIGLDSKCRALISCLDQCRAPLEWTWSSWTGTRCWAAPGTPAEAGSAWTERSGGAVTGNCPHPCRPLHRWFLKKKLLNFFHRRPGRIFKKMKLSKDWPFEGMLLELSDGFKIRFELLTTSTRTIPRPFFSLFLPTYSLHLSLRVGFELRTFCVEGNQSTNCATTTGLARSWISLFPRFTFQNRHA